MLCSFIDNFVRNVNTYSLMYQQQEGSTLLGIYDKPYIIFKFNIYGFVHRSMNQ